MNINERPERPRSDAKRVAVKRRQAALGAPAYDQLGAGIVEVDEAGRILRGNRLFTELTGYTAAELSGRTIFELTDPIDVERDRRELWRQALGEIDSYTIEKRISRKNGGSIWVEVTSSAVRDDNGRFRSAIRVQHDITARKRAEAELNRRLDEQAALFHFSDRLQKISTVRDVCEASLDAICQALDCYRASVLMLDDAAVMRFVAWRGLSGRYRAAVEGHSPWRIGEPSPCPIYLPDAARSDLDPSLKLVLAEEGIGAVAFVPLLGRGKLIGKFMVYHDRPHVFSDPEMIVALTLSRQLGFSIDRIRTEEARKLAERRLSQLGLIVESSDDAIISKDLDGRILTWNAGAEALFGYSAEEALGQPVTLIFPHGREQEEADILARIRRGDRIRHYETVRRRKDGSLVDISLTVSPICDDSGTIVAASKIARDITDRKRAEAAIRSSEQQLQQLLAAIPAAIYTTDAAGRITYFNESAVELAGRRPVIGRDKWCVTWKLRRPDGTPLPHEECPMAVTLREGRPVRGVEAVAERPDGTRVPFIPFPTPLRNEAGEIVGAINMLIDISERREAETQQRLLLDELNHRTKNNMQMLQALLSTTARNAKSAEARQVLEEASARIAAMAAAQRVLYGNADASRFPVSDFLQSICEAAQNAFEPAAVIEIGPASGVLPNGIAMPLALIVNELLTNAVKYGGTERRAVRVGLSERDAMFELYVEDDGEGYDLGSVKEAASGLQLVQGLARQLRGNISVTQKPSRVTMRFPIMSMA